ncbi:MAG: MBOAT family protein [Lawsonibacter sp.]|nr:MBOAT family protein [Lawsonibacter sp.]
MLFNSIDFLLFFPLVTAIYFLLPHQIRWVWLLIASYYFYMCWNAKYALLIALSTLITYLSGLLIRRAEAIPGEARRLRWKRLWVFLSFASNLAILFFFKYFNFFLDNLALALSAAGIAFKRPAFDVMLPVGISFYTFQALSYTADVYRGEVQAEKNPFRYALFVSFFPQLVAGPIERSKNLLSQMYEHHTFDPDRVRNGLLLMLWGMFEKIVVADRLAALVDYVYSPDNFSALPGTAIALATVFFAFQIYCDFAGYSHIAIGAAQVMGFRLMENFRRPYLAMSVADFWRRWHISLSTWFRDYLYIPLGGNRRGKARKYVNTMITFLVSGLWHGANWTFVVWGGLNGAYQVIGELLAPLRERICQALHICPDSPFWRLARTVFTFGLVDFTWLFFRAPSFSAARQMLVHMFTQPHPFVFMGMIFDLGLDKLSLFAALAGVAVLLAADLYQEHRGPLRPVITRQILPVRWVIYLGAVLTVLIFGVYGPGYDARAFTYFQF